MTALEAKQDIIQWINSLEDESSLKKVLLLKDKLNRQVDWWDELTPAQQAGVKRGIADVENSRTHSQEEAVAIYGRWL